MLGEGGETEFNTNINFLLEEYGMTINNGKWLRFIREYLHDVTFFICADSVVRTQYYKYFHPKESMIGGGVACASMCKTLLEQNISTIPFDFSDERLKIQVSILQSNNKYTYFFHLIEQFSAHLVRLSVWIHSERSPSGQHSFNNWKCRLSIQPSIGRLLL